MKITARCFCFIKIFLPLIFFILLLPAACSTGGDVVRITNVSEAKLSGLGEEDLARLAEIKESRKMEKKDPGLENVIHETPNYSVAEYLKLFPENNTTKALEYRVGGEDTLDIMIYEEPDISRQKVLVSADGFISFPFIGRVKVEGLTTSEIEKLLSQKLAQGQFILDAHVSVSVNEFMSKRYMVLGCVKNPGAYSLSAQERVLNAISKAGGPIDTGGNQAMIIRTMHPNTLQESKVVIRIDLVGLLNEGDQVSNLPIIDKDLLYIPKTEYFYVIGQVQKPGSYPYAAKRITLVEAISMAGSFTPLATPNKTRIIRVEDGSEKIIEVKVNEITQAGKKGQDVQILPGDIIVVPESFF